MGEWREVTRAHGDGDEHAAALSDHLGAVLDSACELMAARSHELFAALERTEAACAKLRAWLRENGTS